MKRISALLTVLALLSALCVSPVQAAVRPNDEALFTAAEPSAAMEELGSRLSISITDRTQGGVGLDTLRSLERSVNYLSADLFREAAARLYSRYGVTVEILFVPSTGQPYVGLTSLVVDRSGSYCTVELVDAAPSGASGLNEGTMLHELCHLLNFAMLDEQAVNPVEAAFAGLSGGVPYQSQFEAGQAQEWRQYVDSLGVDPSRCFVSDYAMTDPFEDFACLLQTIALDSDAWERTLLQSSHAALRAKYAAAVSLIERSFASGNDSPLGDLFPAAWAVEEWREAKALGLVPAALDRAYDSPITRAEFCLLMTGLLGTLWGEDPAGVLRAQGIDLSLSPFPDADGEAVAVLCALGVVEGRGDGRFDPDAPITRQEAAKLLALTARAVGLALPAGDPPAFSDADSLSGWAVGSVAAVSAAGIMRGDGDGGFSPRAAYDRQQSFLTVLRLYKLATGI